MIKIQNVSYRVKDKDILKNINLEILPNERLALLGHNGSGKSTLIDIITNAIKQTEGKVEILNSSFRNVKGRVGVLYEYPPLFPYFKVKEFIAYICLIHGVKLQEISLIIQNLSIDKINNSLINVLSKGERKKLGILLMMIHNPEFIILDEPTAEIDPFTRDIAWNLFTNEKRTIFFTTHQWEEAQVYADKIAFISEGKILAIDLKDAFLSNKYINGDKKIIISKKNQHVKFDEGEEYFRYEDDEQIHVFPKDMNAYLQKIGSNTNFSVMDKSIKDVFLFIENKKI
ncbi:MAG: ABC transporter ATP-binding protein [Bacteroidales bacterium]|nr:ABC transporter ATP-binding protein [Bacteroidales bacterium]